MTVANLHYVSSNPSGVGVTSIAFNIVCPPREMEEAPRHDPLGASLVSDERLARYSRLSERDAIVRVLCRHCRQTRYSVVAV